MPTTRRSKGRKNPEDSLQSAARMSARFHGRPPQKVRSVVEERRERTKLAELGDLRELQVRLPSGDKATIGLEGVALACTADGRQIYFVGGDQSVDLAHMKLAGFKGKDRVFIGLVEKIVYHTSKAFHSFEPSDYVHRFGEDGGTEPLLMYDALNKSLYLSSGSYLVRPEGIVN